MQLIVFLKVGQVQKKKHFLMIQEMLQIKTSGQQTLHGGQSLHLNIESDAWTVAPKQAQRTWWNG